jgi:hypothetical protein
MYSIQCVLLGGRGGGDRGPQTDKHLPPSSVADPGYLSRIRPFSIPDPGSASKNLSILTQKNGSKLWEYDPGCSSRIRIRNTAAKYLYWSIFRKSRHLGFGVCKDIWSMWRQPCLFTNQKYSTNCIYRTQAELKTMRIQREAPVSAKKLQKSRTVSVSN